MWQATIFLHILCPLKVPIISTSIQETISMLCFLTLVPLKLGSEESYSSPRRRPIHGLILINSQLLLNRSYSMTIEGLRLRQTKTNPSMDTSIALFNPMMIIRVIQSPKKILSPSQTPLLILMIKEPLIIICLVRAPPKIRNLPSPITLNFIK